MFIYIKKRNNFYCLFPKETQISTFYPNRSKFYYLFPTFTLLASSCLPNRKGNTALHTLIHRIFNGPFYSRWKKILCCACCWTEKRKTICFGKCVHHISFYYHQTNVIWRVIGGRVQAKIKMKLKCSCELAGFVCSSMNTTVRAHRYDERERGWKSLKGEHMEFNWRKWNPLTTVNCLWTIRGANEIFVQNTLK